MFKKNISVSSTHQLSGKDGKELRKSVLKAFPAINEEQLALLLPGKSGLVQTKLSNRCVVYSQEGGNPLFFDPDGRGGLLPTVYALAVLPQLLPQLHTWSEISGKMLGGADLFLQGVLVPQALLAAAGSPDAWRQEALDVVRGWAWGLPEAVEATPPEDLSRSRLVDRWALPPPSSGRLSLTLAGDALHPMTPNLGQGGCTALEDALVLGRSLQQAGAPALAAALQDALAGSGSGQRQQQAAAAAVREAVGRYEQERTKRCLPLTIRSHLMGAALQSALPPVVLARDLFVERAFSPAHFLDHAAYDCGRLEGR